MDNQYMLQIKTSSQNTSLKKKQEKGNLRFQRGALLSSFNV